MTILFIPHAPNIKLINRVYEFTKTSKEKSYFLYWEIENSSLFAKVISQLKSFFLPFVKRTDKENTTIQTPLVFRPSILAPKINTFILNRAIQKYDIDIVVNANALLFNIEKINVPVIYDLVDDHLSLNKDIGVTESVINKIKNDIRCSKGVVCVSDSLADKIRLLNNNIITIENGLYLDRFKNAKSLKNELGLKDKKVYGYIGGVEEWTGIDKAIEAYLQIKNKSNAFIIVGDSKSTFFKLLKQKYQNDVLFIGQVDPSKVANYFKTLDIGLIPFKLNDFTHNAYPIKALEYGLAGAQVISTPLNVLKSKQFPFIIFCEISKFSTCMMDVKNIDFKFDFEDLSWTKQSEKLIDFIKTEH